VYLAVRADDAYERRVVVKLARPGMESEAVLRRLRTERQILASLEHPYIARLYDGGSTDEGLPYFVLEYVEGVPIDVYCERNQLSVDERLVLFRKVCEAVRYAHQNLVVHRDLKPSNIMVTATGEPRLLDFGIAKLLNPDLAGSLEATATWHRVLTPNYASPEQIRGHLITTASDVYSLGVLLYELLTGRLPHLFGSRSVQEIESILFDSEPLPPSRAVTRPVGDTVGEPVAQADPPDQPRTNLLRRQLAGDLDAIVLKALRSTPPRRYGSVEQLAADIERYQLGLPVEARAGSWRYRAGKFVRRNRRAVVAAAAFALLVAGFIVATALQVSRVSFERDQARRERDKKTQVLGLVLELFEFSNPFVAPGEELTVRQALERSVPILDKGLREQPEIRAELLHTSGSILTVLGAYDNAQQQLSEALEIRRQVHGDSHPDVAASLSALAGALRGRGELDRAEELARRAVAIVHALPDGDGSVRAQSLNELLNVLAYQDEFNGAGDLAREALELTAELPPDSVHRIVALEHLAKYHSVQGDHAEAVRLNREAVALGRARWGEDHPRLLVPLNNLGINLRRMEDLDGAESAYKEALRVHRANFGEEFPNQWLLGNLAGVHYAKGELGEAMRLYRKARQTVLDTAGPQHWRIYYYDLRIARTRNRQGAAAEAEAELRRAIDLWRPTLGDHWRLDEGLSVLGESISIQGRCAEAEPLLVDSFERMLGKTIVRAQKGFLERLRDHFERCGQPQEAARYAAMLAEVVA
jgi:serine/threonine-protein kinase